MSDCIGGDAEEPNPTLLEKGLPLAVGGLLSRLIVDFAVNLHGETELGAVESRSRSGPQVLTPELPMEQLPIAEVSPQHVLRLRRLPPKRPRGWCVVPST